MFYFFIFLAAFHWIAGMGYFFYGNQPLGTAMMAMSIAFAAHVRIDIIRNRHI